MLFHVEMTVHLPPSLDVAETARLRAEEKAMAMALQRTGKWRHLWRLVGRYANISIFDVATNAELHEILTQLPLFPYMEIEVRPLCQHPSSITAADDPLHQGRAE
jgi:muconolactone D-isomerase